LFSSQGGTRKVEHSKLPAEYGTAMEAIESGWARELATRARKSLIVTVVGTTLLTAVFFAGYFYIQMHPMRPPHEMSLTKLDLLVPFQAEFLFVYLSLWIYLGAGPGLQPDSTAIARYALWMSALGIAGLLIFRAWPTQVPAFTMTAAFPGIRTLQQVDMASNACPSMHVAAAIFTAIRVDQVFVTTRSPVYMRLLNGAWFTAIAYSTLAVRQHVVWDVVAGALLGGSFALVSLIPERMQFP
jgi:PAP2 superfamily